MESHSQRRSNIYYHGYEATPSWEREGGMSRSWNAFGVTNSANPRQDEHESMVRWKRESHSDGPWNGIGTVYGTNAARRGVSGISDAGRGSICATCGSSRRSIK